MKKKSLLILPIVLLSLAACQENQTTTDGDRPSAPDETYTENSSYSTYGVIDYVNQRGAAISSWTGVYSYWDVTDELYADGSYWYGTDDLYLDEEDSYYYTDELYAVTNDGVLTGIETVNYRDYYETTKGIEYYDGSNVYLNEDGEVTTSTASRSLSYYTSDLGDTIDDCIYYATYDYLVPTESGYTSSSQATVTTSLGTAKSGNTQAYISDVYYEAGYYGYWYYCPYELLQETTMTLVYDSKDQLVSMEYSFVETYIEYGIVERYVESITYLPYSGTIEVPSWVN